MIEQKFSTLKNIVKKAISNSKSKMVVDEVGERHGSWEWLAHSPKRDPYKELNRFVVLAVTGPAPAYERPASMYEVEIWAGADNDERFARRLVAAFQVPEDQVQNQAMLNNITAYLSEAVGVAEWLRPIHLTEAYLRPIREPIG